ncbi:RNA methylase [Nitzschia inconspicua]|uniref:RNA methylase n=1 Tax=Nitzschia inconspicua TaxID=303405 RepID=A0A9K3KZE3_9STRA|nr:RNA methylase [Nitzschia inconspicua]
MPTDADEDAQWRRVFMEELRQNVNGDNDSSMASNSNRSMVAAAGIVAGVSVLVGLQFPFLFPKSAPYMATPGPKIRHALKFLKKTRRRDSDKNPSQPPVFVDLGSGDGQAVYEAARLGYRAIGIEFNWTLWAISSMRRQLFWTRQEKALSSFLRQDFHSYNLKNADTIMIFAIPKTMPILGSKIQLECGPGTDIVAYRFGIPLAIENSESDLSQDKPSRPLDESEQAVRLHADLIYDRADMRIYRTKF